MSHHSLMFGWEFPPHHTGGLGVACEGLVKGMLHQGMRVTLVLPMVVEHLTDHIAAQPGDLRHCTIPVPSLLLPYDTELSYASRVESMPMELRQLYGPNMGDAVMKYAERAAAVTAHLEPDVVHSHDWMTYAAGQNAADHHGVPHIAHIHATELDRTNFQPHPWIFDREREGLLRANRIIAVSHYTKRLLVEHYGIAADKIAVVHNGHHVLHDSIPPVPQIRHGMPKDPLVLFLGRLTVQKNPHQFLDVAERIHRVRPDVRFVLAGEGGMLPELLERTCAMGLQECMLFTGKVNRTEADALYRSASCFVMPSLSEPFGLVALEAVGHGVPVVVSKQSGVSEVLDHAFAVDYWDTDKMADCILTILRERPLADQLRTEAQGTLRRLTWKNQAGLVARIYDSLLSPSVR